jgi:hypothetical protein
VVGGIAAASTVAQADPQPTVGAEDQVPALVVGVRLVDEQDLPARVRNGAATLHGVLDDPGVGARVGVVDVEAPVGREGQAEQSLFGARRDIGGDVENGSGVDLAASDGPDAATLLGNVKGAVAGAQGHGHRLVEAGDPSEPELDVGQVGAARGLAAAVWCAWAARSPAAARAGVGRGCRRPRRWFARRRTGAVGNGRRGERGPSAGRERRTATPAAGGQRRSQGHRDHCPCWGSHHH